MFNSDEEPDYRSPVNLTPRTTVSTDDERDFSTLKLLLKIARDADKKARDMNSIDLSNQTVTATEQIHGLQFALDTLITPFLTSVENAVKNIEAQNRGEES